MKSITLTSTIDVFDDLLELPQDIQDLMNKAAEARNKAYAPYSKFNVGAAILLENGVIVTGSNQENASYPSGLCAERTAIYYAGAKFPDVEIKTIVITATSVSNPMEVPIPPCGACRQAIAEYEVKQKSPIAIYFMGEKGKVAKAHSLKDLLPLLFDNSYL